MDPLSPHNINPGWSSSPETPTQSLFSPPPPVSPIPPTPNSATSFMREPKVFGAPGLGLVSPSVSSHDVANGTGSGNGESSGSKTKQQAPYLRVRIGGLERNRKDLLIRFDASTNLPNFRTAMYRNMQRSYVEFQRFAEQAQLVCPQTIIPALPLATTSAVTDEEDDRLVRIALQRWFTRICEDPVLMKDDELRNFIESDFGYQPVPPPSARKPTSAASAVPQVFTAALNKVVRRGPLDEDDESQSAKGALEKLEERWGGAAAAIGNLGKSRRALGVANADIGAKLVSLSTVESDMHLAAAERKMGRAWEQLSGMLGAQAANENVVLSDSLGYQALNARAAKDALLQRTQLLEDSQTATKSAINKRRNVERLKGSSSINPSKVDDALSEMEEANTLETSLTNRLNAISTNLHAALRTHSRHAHEDVTVSLLEVARLSVMFHKHALREIESIKPDLQRIGNPAAAAAPPLSAGVVGAGAQRTPTRATVKLPPQSQPQLQPHFAPQTPQYQSPPQQREYHSPPVASRAPMDTSKSMFLPPPPQQPAIRPPPPHASAVDPLGGQMAQSMILPNHQQQQRPGVTVGRPPVRRLDERKAAKMLAGGF